MKLAADLNAFARTLGHDFAKPELLVRAVTHSSMATAHRDDNQRLEFLGDRVLNLVIADAIFAADPSAAEGELAVRYNYLVRKETCADVAREWGLGEVLKIGRSEMKSGGRRKTAILGDALEAVIAAIYLDAGLDAVRAVILRIWGERISTAATESKDAKTALQEWAQARGIQPPKYTEISREGPDHAPVFLIEARLETGEAAQASDTPKRLAEQAAAEALLQKVSP
ncbi:MAG: ribonuclease III [Thalassobium sp.]|uniref:ribonuclease III n=1 Tax=Octadecabacter sp. SW4 TaxID=2602067 RepID=UPI000C101F39|nr:ribonuclease III [Octadecabacter sp. SW4]PHQ81793.1 MAG: ribonuclease III [Thalassobium sp.]QEE34464.1 ribonuclease III [Octadecabacter sp. SW4]